MICLVVLSLILCYTVYENYGNCRDNFPLQLIGSDCGNEKTIPHEKTSGRDWNADTKDIQDT